MNLRLLRSVALLMAAIPALAAEAPLPVVAYYFPRPELCTVMIDFQKGRSAVENLKGDERTLALAQNMAAEFDRNGKQKCGDAARIRMLAVFINGVDVYGRTDFGNRVNLLRLDADTKNLRQLASYSDRLTLAQIKNLSQLETY